MRPFTRYLLPLMGLLAATATTPAAAGERSDEVTHRLYQASELLGRLRACGLQADQAHLSVLRDAVLHEAALGERETVARESRRHFRTGVRLQNLARRGVQCTRLKSRYGRRGISVVLLYGEVMQVDRETAETALARLEAPS